MKVRDEVGLCILNEKKRAGREVYVMKYTYIKEINMNIGARLVSRQQPQFSRFQILDALSAARPQSRKLIKAAASQIMTQLLSKDRVQIRALSTNVSMLMSSCNTSQAKAAMSAEVRAILSVERNLFEGVKAQLDQSTFNRLFNYQANPAGSSIKQDPATIEMVRSIQPALGSLTAAEKTQMVDLFLSSYNRQHKTSFTIREYLTAEKNYGNEVGFQNEKPTTVTSTAQRGYLREHNLQKSVVKGDGNCLIVSTLKSIGRLDDETNSGVIAGTIRNEVAQTISQELDTLAVLKYMAANNLSPKNIDASILRLNRASGQYIQGKPVHRVLNEQVLRSNAIKALIHSLSETYGELTKLSDAVLDRLVENHNRTASTDLSVAELRASLTSNPILRVYATYNAMITRPTSPLGV
ncbi:MAG: hypothetical protein ACI9BD_001223, partial [Candidatus Marinamargulisbacteria bacterium]